MPKVKTIRRENIKPAPLSWGCLALIPIYFYLLRTLSRGTLFCYLI